MMNKILLYAVFILGAACLTEGYFLHAAKARPRSPAEEILARHDQWVADIENLKKRMTPMQQDEQGSLLGQAFEDWFQAKVAVSGIRSDVKITDRQVIVSFKIPGLKAETLKIVVNDVLIRATYSARSFVEANDERGAYRSEAVRQFETVMPVPSDADAAKHRFIQEGEGFKIIFEKRDDPALKS